MWSWYVLQSLSSFLSFSLSHANIHTSVLGTNLFPAKEKPYYHKGAWVSCGMCLLITVTSLALTLYLMRENRRLEKAGLLVHDSEEIMDAPEEAAGRAKQYKYVY